MSEGLRYGLTCADPLGVSEKDWEFPSFSIDGASAKSWPRSHARQGIGCDCQRCRRHSGGIAPDRQSQLESVVPAERHRSEHLVAERCAQFGSNIADRVILRNTRFYLMMGWISETRSGLLPVLSTALKPASRPLEPIRPGKRCPTGSCIQGSRVHRRRRVQPCWSMTPIVASEKPQQASGLPCCPA